MEVDSLYSGIMKVKDLVMELETALRHDVFAGLTARDAARFEDAQGHFREVSWAINSIAAVYYREDSE